MTEDNKSRDEILYTVAIIRPDRFFKKTTWDIIRIKSKFVVRCENVPIEITIRSENYDQITVKELITTELESWELFIKDLASDN